MTERGNTVGVFRSSSLVAVLLRWSASFTSLFNVCNTIPRRDFDHLLKKTLKEERERDNYLRFVEANNMSYTGLSGFCNYKRIQTASYIFVAFFLLTAKCFSLSFAIFDPEEEMQRRRKIPLRVRTHVNPFSRPPTRPPGPLSFPMSPLRRLNGEKERRLFYALPMQ